MASVRQFASCIDAPGDLSVLQHVFGFLRRRVPTDPAQPGTTGFEVTQVSLLQRINRLKNQRFNLNVIRVGWDQFDGTTNPTRDQMNERADYAVYRMHDIYDQQDIAVGRVRFWTVDADDADGLDVLDNDAELDLLTDTWSVDNDGLDIFIPFAMNMGGLLGRSEIDGPCTKEFDEKVRDASVVNPRGAENNNGDAGLGMARTFSHENGHYLGLSHPNNQENFPTRLMTQTGAALNNGGSARTSIVINNSEGTNCKDHCSIQSGC